MVAILSFSWLSFSRPRQSCAPLRPPLFLPAASLGRGAPPTVVARPASSAAAAAAARTTTAAAAPSPPSGRRRRRLRLSHAAAEAAATVQRQLELVVAAAAASTYRARYNSTTEGRISFTVGPPLLPFRIASLPFPHAHPPIRALLTEMRECVKLSFRRLAGCVLWSTSEKKMD